MERKLRLTLLLREGDYRHNMTVLNEDVGEILVWRENCDAAEDRCRPCDFAACPYCKLFLYKEGLDHHKEICAIKNFFQLELPEFEDRDDVNVPPSKYKFMLLDWLD